MKAVKSLILFTVGALLTYQSAASAEEPPREVQCYSTHYKQKCQLYDRLNYAKIGVGTKLDNFKGDKSGSFGVGPSFGFGRRYEMGEMGVDISANFSQSGKNSFAYSIPRIMALRFLQPSNSSSFYAGIGGSIGGVHSKVKENRFHGLFGDLCVGYEFCRDKPIRSFIELGAGHGILSFQGKAPQRFNPVMSLTYGIGF